MIMKKKWSASKGIELEEAAIDAVYCDENALVIAGPGAGKTELLTQKAGFLFTTDRCAYPKKILAISFKKDAAENFKNRIDERFGNEYEDRLISTTYDAFFKSIVDRFHKVLPEDYSLNPDYVIVDDNVVKDILIKIGHSELKGIKGYKANTCAANIVKNSDFSRKDESMQKFWKIMLQGDEDNFPSLTFLMIAKLCLLIIQSNVYIRKIICSTYSHVFLDEFQDTTELQYMIVKELFQNSNVRITAVGDNKQRIMLWAGALKTVFDDFYKDFSATKFNLSKNYRSAPKLLELQKMMYLSLGDNSKGICCADKWNEDDGNIQLLFTSDENVEANKIAEMISNDIKLGILKKEIAIICKQKVDDYTIEVVKALKKRGIRARNETEYQELIKDDLIRIYLDIFILATSEKNPKSFENVISFLLMIFPESDSSQKKYINMHKKFAEFLKKINLSLLDIDSLKDLENVINEIIEYCDCEQMKAIFPQYKQGEYFEKQTKKFADLLWKEYELANYSWLNAISGFLGESSIPIMTIHKSKGLEYSSVYFLGLEDSAFWSFKKQPEENRALFFVALSRAKRKITFTFSEKRNNFKQPEQSRMNIKEFYELLENIEGIEIIEVNN